MKTLAVVQHTSAEYLGLLEDHLEGRQIRFHYSRPFTAGGRLPGADALPDGLVLLGGGPWGSAGGRDLPTLQAEIELTRAALDGGKPLLGVGLGAQILSIAAGGGSSAAPLQFRVSEARRIETDALAGYLPERFPLVTYGRDEPDLPASARVLAVDEAGRPAVFQLGKRALGFTGHPGIKAAIIEDLIMEFDESPEQPGPTLAQLRMTQRSIEDALVPTMTGLIKVLGLME